MKTWLLIGLMAAMIMVSVNAETWLDDCQKRCEGDRCNAIIGRTVWVRDSDGFCKEIEKAKSLKSRFYVEKTDDNIHGLEVVDFNYSCITIKPYWEDLSFGFNKNIPLKIDGVVQGYVKIPNVLSPLVSLTFCPMGSALSHNYSFGEKSTTIQLINNETEVLDDAKVRLDYPTLNYWNTTLEAGVFFNYVCYSYLKFNLSSISAGSTIEDSVLFINITTEFYDTGDNPIIYVFNVSNQTWSEKEITWNNKPAVFDLLSSYVDGNSDGSTGKRNFSVTDWVSLSFSLGYSNISFMLNATASGISDYYVFGNKESGVFGRHPYLNITYSEGGGEPECGSSHCDLCETQGDCETASCYWWADETCHDTEESAACWTESGRLLSVPLGCLYQNTTLEEI